MEVTVKSPTKLGKYQIRGTIGQGAFSVVKLAYDEINKRYLACKIVPKTRLDSPELEDRFEIEIHIFQQLAHPGIVILYDLLKDENNYYVFMEFCPNGELFQHIVDNGHLTEEEGRIIVKQFLNALAYIHNKGIAHRDLKPENLLLDENGQVKLSDFGLSRFVGNSGIANTPCGSPCYASPECVSGHPYNAYTSDVWSAGVIIYAMLTGQLPWTKRNQAQLFKQIRRGEYSIPTFLSPECQNFISGLMTVDINKRLTIDQAFKHPWMTGYPIPMSLMPAEEMRYPLVSLKRVDMFFESDAADDIKIDDNEIFKNPSFSAKGYVKIVKGLTHSDSKARLPPIQVKYRPTPSRQTTTGHPSLQMGRHRAISSVGKPNKVTVPHIKRAKR